MQMLNKTTKKPLILVTNDDGIFAPGIKALVDVALTVGEVVVVAPNSPQSGQGHAITIHEPIRLRQVNAFDNVQAYECSGTPVDCVKLAKNVILKDRQIDLCVSGINHGSNASINIIYSGTMSAAMEASLEGIKSIGFSHLDYSFEAELEPAKRYMKMIIDFILDFDMGACRLLNVNIPNLPLPEIKGIKVCRQAEGKWKEEFVESSDPRGEKYYWMTGSFELQHNGNDTDIWALKNGYVSVVPSFHDLTHHPSITPLKVLENVTS